MGENLRDRLLKNSPWRAVLLAVILLVAGELLLAWQYRQLEGNRLAEIEQKLAEQERALEQRAAQDALEEFFEARMAGDEKKLVRYVTEQAMQQRERGLFELYGVQDYEITQWQEAGEGLFRFSVSLSRDRLAQTELIEVKKILEQYYVDSVELAG